MSNFDINAIVTELTQRLIGSELKNIFEINEVFFFKFHTRKEGTQFLVIEPGKRIHISKYQRIFPEEPSGLCKAFRLHLKEKWLKRIYQYDFDRICVMEFELKEKIYTVIIELFGKGNIVLLSPENKILVAKNYKKMRDRDIHPGLEFHFPPTTGKNFLEADLNWAVENITQSAEANLESAISITLNINKDFAKELCLRAKVQSILPLKELSNEQILEIKNQIDIMRKKVLSNTSEPTEYYTNDSASIVDITPFPLVIYANFPFKTKESFSSSLDDYFSSMEVDKSSTLELSTEQKKVKQLIAIRKKQEEYLLSFQEAAELEKQKGNLIYMYLNEIDELLTTITNARRKNINWLEIKEKLFEAKKKNLKSVRLLKEILEKDKTIIVELDKVTVSLNFLLSGSENAKEMYEKAKKAEGKIPGAEKKISELNKQIKDLEDGYIQLTQKEKIMLEKRKKEWYEKFHWFFSSDGLLVLAGKDLRSNNELVKKYLEKDDLFLHAEIHGASVVIIKSNGKVIPEQTLMEAAVFSVSYSKAWKDNLSNENTFWVKSDQVSFSAPSGEYLSKGSFIIKGEKNILKNIPLEIALHLIINEKWAYCIAAPYSALVSQKNIDKLKIVRIIPGDYPKSKISHLIISKFKENVTERDLVKIDANISNDLITLLPGNCYIKDNDI